jgi:pSer/pThr/pTyr-binding forkhead associated (FHA) protein
VKSTTISRRHARIVIDEQTASVEDLDSKNGTYVNNRRVSVPTPVVRWRSDSAGIASLHVPFLDRSDVDRDVLGFQRRR